jgi:hypothetical protein
MTAKSIELKAMGNPYYAAIISIVFVAFSISSLLVGCTVAAVLILYYALTTVQGITLRKDNLAIKYFLRNRSISKSEITLQWKAKQVSVLQLQYPGLIKTRKVNLEVTYPSDFELWCNENEYELIP